MSRLPTKGELLLSYDEEELVESEIDFVKEIWDDEYRKEYGDPTDEAVEKIVWNRLSDGWLNQNHWNDFVEGLTDLMKKRSPRLEWESPDYHSYDDDYHQEDQKFMAYKGMDLLGRLVNFQKAGNISFVRVYAYGNDGFCIDPEWQPEKCVIAACRHGFYRDWERDGICVAVEQEDEWP